MTYNFYKNQFVSTTTKTYKQEKLFKLQLIIKYINNVW